ncbi:MAG TPA: hypothetical protein VLR46_13445 [Candidatus Dormibacteraeota bacterium]|nr:hypothetical protein [Candidatus Dormibacteraeota bacterium]
MERRVGRLLVLTAVFAILVAAFASPAQASNSTREHGARHRPVSITGRASLAPASALARSLAARVQAATVSGHSGDLAANFEGVSSLDSQITNFNLTFEPPDQGLCVGNGFVVEMVNSAFRVYDTHGNTLAGPTNVNAPFHEDFAAFTSDPRCHYDPATNTWFASVLFINDAGTASTEDIAYNTTGDPTTDWSVFRIDTTRAGAPVSFGCPCFGDQPRLGIDASNIYVSTDEFSILGQQFNGAQIYAISKSDLVAHKSKVHFVHYKDLSIGGAQALSVQPALTFGPASAEYFLSSLDPNGTGDNRIGVWALTNVDRVSKGGKPRLSSVIINSEAYAIPPQAEQKRSTSMLDSGDDRMQQTQFINGQIWGELTTAITPVGDTAQRAGAAWFRVQPDLSGSRLEGATVTGQGYVVSRGANVIYPAVQADGQGHAAMVFTLVGEDKFASAAYSTFKEDGSGFGKPEVAAVGSGPYNATPQRWGDYSWAVLDPASDSVWMATEYMPPKSSQTTNGRRPWGTRVLHLDLQ